jgi:chromosome segregation ATPase
VRFEYLGKRIVCKYCKHHFVAETSEDIPPSTLGKPGISPDEIEDAKHQVRDLEQELEQLRSELATRRAEQASADHKFHKALEHITWLEDQIEQTQAVHKSAAALQEELNDARAELERLRATEQTLKSKNADVERLETSLRAGGTDNARLQKEIESLQTQLSNKPDEHALELSRQELQSLREELNDARAELERLRATEQTLKGKNVDVERLETSLRASGTDNARLQKEIESLQAQLATKPDEHALELSRGELKSVRAERDSLLGEVQSLRACIEQTSASQVPPDVAERLETELQASREENHRLRAELNDLQEQLGGRPDPQAFESTVRELTAAQSERDSLSAEVRSLRASLEEVSAGQQQRLAALAEEVEGLQRERDHLRTLREADGHEAEQLRTNLAAQEQALAEAAAAHEETHSSLKRAHEQEREQWEVRHQSLEADWQRRHQTHVESSEAKLRTNLAALEQALVEAAAAHSSLKRAHEQERKQWEARHQSLEADWQRRHQTHVESSEAKLREEQERSTAERDALQERFVAMADSSEQQRRSHQNEIGSLRQEFAAVRLERDATATQLAGLREERDNLVGRCDSMSVSQQQMKENHEAEISRLSQALEGSRRQEEATVQSNQELNKQVESLRAELSRQGEREGENLRGVSLLRQELQSMRARAVVERQKLQEGHDVAQRQWEQDRDSLQARLAQLGEEMTALRQERDSIAEQMAAFHQDRQGISALQKSFQQAERRFQVELVGLTEAIELARKREESFTRTNHELEEKVYALSKELEQQREREYEQIQKAPATQEGPATNHTEIAAGDKPQEQLNALHWKFEAERQALQEEVERARREAASLRQALNNMGVFV